MASAASPSLWRVVEEDFGFNLVLGVKLTAAEKSDLVAFLRQL